LSIFNFLPVYLSIYIQRQSMTLHSQIYLTQQWVITNQNVTMASKENHFIPHDVSYKYVTHENETYISSGCPKNLQIRDRPFNLKGRVMVFCFVQNFFFQTTRELEYFFFVVQSANFFFQNSTIGYMTKTLNQIFFFFFTKIRIFFSATLGIRIFF
jgi:hypothetical protein